MQIHYAHRKITHRNTQMLQLRVSVLKTGFSKMRITCHSQFFPDVDEDAIAFCFANLYPHFPHSPLSLTSQLLPVRRWEKCKEEKQGRMSQSRHMRNPGFHSDSLMHASYLWHAAQLYHPSNWHTDCPRSTIFKIFLKSPSKTDT